MAILDKEYISYADIAQLLDIDYATIHRWAKRKDSTLPKPFKLSGKKVVFKSSEIINWIESQRER